jgi:hypothetical protein
MHNSAEIMIGDVTKESSPGLFKMMAVIVDAPPLPSEMKFRRSNNSRNKTMGRFIDMPQLYNQWCH